MTNLAALPIEILSLIMDYVDQRRDLYNCALLNSQFHALVNSLLWRAVHFQDQPYHAGFCFLHCLELVGRYFGRCVRHVHIQGFSWTDRTVMILMRHAPLLTYLILDDATRITDTSIQHIAYYWPYLQTLHLDSSPITPASYRVLGQLPQLLTLALWNCIGLEPDSFLAYFKDSPLKKLMLAVCADDDHDDDEEEEDDDDKATIDITGLHQLTHLQLHGPSFDMLNQALTLDNQGDVYCCWPRLTSLHLEACFDMMDIDALSLLLALPSGLTHLTIKDGAFTNITLNAIATYQPHLITLDVSFNNQFTPRGIRRMVRRCPQLTLVMLSYCGMTMEDFPEAGPECEGTVVTFENTFIGLDHLNQRAIDEIRRGPDFGDQDEEEEDGNGD